MKRLFVLAVIFTLVLTGCQSAETPVEPTPLVPTQTVESNPLDPDLLGQVWYWRAFMSNDDVQHVVVENPEAYTLQFMEDGRIAIQADCNNAGGDFVQQDSSLSFGMMQVTAQYCGDESLDMDYMGYLNDVVSYVIEDGVLHLILKIDAGNVVFTQAPDSPLPLLADLQPDTFSLVGPVWYWQAFQSMSDEVGETVVANPQDYTFQLNPDGTAQIQADCNSGFGNYTYQDGSLTFEQIATTKMACPEGSLGNEFVSDLNYAATYVYEDGLLYLNLAMDAGDMIFSTTPEPVALPFD